MPHTAKKTTMPRPGGVIATLVDILVAAREKQHPVTKNEIVQRLHRKFPDRDANAMRTTVQAQLSRLPKERKFKIKRTQSDKGVAYAAA